MTDARAISAQLVDIRNVGTHKCVKLTIHAPEEQAMRIMELFGWPTGVRPVSVAIARLNEGGEADIHERSNQPPETPPRSIPSRSSGGADNPGRRTFEEMSPAQQSGMLCNEIAFQKYLKEQHRIPWASCIAGVSDNSTDWGRDAAAAVVRELCEVNSRADITRDNAKWSALVLAYRLWQRHPELEATA